MPEAAARRLAELDGTATLDLTVEAKILAKRFVEKGLIPTEQLMGD